MWPGLGSVIGHAERTRPLRDYCTGLMLSGRTQERRADGGADGSSADGGTAPVVAAFCRRNATWSDERTCWPRCARWCCRRSRRADQIEAWIIDDTSFPKQGKHSVGVHHQYCGQLGKQANCQVAVSLSIANHAASLPVARRLASEVKQSTAPLTNGRLMGVIGTLVRALRY